MSVSEQLKTDFWKNKTERENFLEESPELEEKKAQLEKLLEELNGWRIDEDFLKNSRS